MPLMGRDLLSKLDTQITFKNGEVQLLIPKSKAVEAKIFMLRNTPRLNKKIPAEVEYAVIPLVWASGIPGRSKLVEPVKVVLKSGSKPVRQNQDPIKWEAREGLEELITKFFNYGLLIVSPKSGIKLLNTNVALRSRHSLLWRQMHRGSFHLAEKQDGKEYRLVQDLRAVNQIVQDIYPVAANPYTLLTSLKQKHKWFTALNLRDAFFCIPLDKNSPSDGKVPLLDKKQSLPGRPTMIWNQLAKKLELWKKENPEGTILQYVDDILLAAETWGERLQITINLLNFLGQGEYRVSKNKAQVGKETVIYLGFEISQGQRRLGTDTREVICQTPEPRTVQELKAFLGMVGWCTLWILSYGLHEALKGSKENHLLWTPECQVACKNVKRALMSAPALGLPNLSKLFELFTHELQHLALGMLTQRLGAWRRAVGYFSKQLDNVSKGWPGCLCAVAATVLLIQEDRKLTIGQRIIVYVPHMVTSVLEQKGAHRLALSHMLKYQVILLEQDDVELKTTIAINPAMFLNSEVRDSEPLHHNCLQTIEHVYSSRQDLRDEPLTNPDLELFTDGSSFVRDGKWMAGYEVVTPTQVIETGALPINTSAQKAELVALRQALKVAKGKQVNIWADSKYAFGTDHAHGATGKKEDCCRLKDHLSNTRKKFSNFYRIFKDLRKWQ
ncbi:hypothetical protein QYF61_012654 [Mycteria americana]|uniref:RNase H type-1 domain-containing protein n=1 Tax=Mycteria americana TaxID=33587 RepID=A0AAN7N1W0_MYCAM|nr:hypothetical protein QYF61_012654 [Mycteria americana]